MIGSLIVIAGIFVVTAFSIVILELQKNQLQVGFWPLIAATAAFLTLAEIGGLMGNEYIHMFLVIVTFILLFMVALIKYWDTMKLVQK